MVSKADWGVKPHTRASTRRNAAAPHSLRPMCVLFRFRVLLDDSLSCCFYLVGAARFELAAPSPPDRCPSTLSNDRLDVFPDQSNQYADVSF
jgi:hypothetical protein